MTPLFALRLTVALSACAASVACAHTFGTVYNLPVPFSRYAWGASAALLVSFVIVAYFASVPQATTLALGTRPRPTRARASLPRALVYVLRAFSLFALALTIVAGFIGTRNPYANINMTLFWVFFVLGCFYLVALVGDLYDVANPWRTLCKMLERGRPGLFRARRAYPPALAYYPALLLYMAFIWIELFARTQPRSLSVVVAVYTAINLVGALVVGKDA